MRALITGVTGFAGSHLAEMLVSQNDEVIGVARHPRATLDWLQNRITLVFADLQHPGVVRDLLDHHRPDVVYHLAGQAFVPLSWRDPWDTLQNNIRPQLNLLQSLVDLKLDTRLLVVTSNQVYGHVTQSDLPVAEDAPFRPDNPYGVSKAAQDLLGLQYFQSHGVNVLRARPFNHIGPRQSPMFVAASFARQIARIEAGLSEPVIKVGNLEARRDFTDVVDVVRAYTLLARHGQPGEAYNIGVGRAYSIQYLLDTLLSFTTRSIEVCPDADRMRPADVPVIYADNRKLREATGWKPTISFEDSLLRVLEYWRSETQQSLKTHS
ncbi:MAG: SDR family oxidoreductase [Chloroflexi bacterium]|nr:MAG: SDR family oxidoreductase [Chloroflexota bacterium]